jgi:hypothetical protein
MRKLAPVLAFVALLPLPVAAQWGVREVRADEPLKLYAYTLKHQAASEALALVEPLLSGRGTVELRVTDNTLVVRDTEGVLSSIGPVLQRFDHPTRNLSIEVTIIRARRASFSPVLQEEPLPEPLARRLKDLLPYSTYSVLARTDLPTREGEEVTYELGEGFGVRFRTGTVMEGQRVKLHGFRITRASGAAATRNLIHGNLSLQLARTFTMTLAGSEGSSTALVVVLEPRLAAEAD